MPLNVVTIFGSMQQIDVPRNYFIKFEFGVRPLFDVMIIDNRSFCERLVNVMWVCAAVVRLLYCKTVLPSIS
jgi:hypothetical protein